MRANAGRWSGRLPAVVAGSLALVPWILALAANGGRPLSRLGAAAGLAAVASNAFVFDAFLITIAAPLAGVAIGARRVGSAPRVLGAVANLVAVFVVVSAVIGYAVSRAGGLDPIVVVQSRVTVAAASLALASLGALAGRIFDDVLDAAGASVLLAVVAAGGLLVAGAGVDRLSKRSIDVGLLASPVIATTAAARIDLLRGATLYRLSAIAHRRFDYPPWWLSATVYLGVAGSCTAGIGWQLRAGKSDRSL